MIDQHSDLDAERQDLQRDRAALVSREIELEKEAIRRDELKQDALILECRNAQDELAELSRQTELAQASWRAAHKIAQEADDEFRQHSSAKPKNFPLPKELATWESKLADLQVACRRAVESDAAAYEIVDKLQQQRRRDHVAFEELKWREHNSVLDLNFRRAELKKRLPVTPVPVEMRWPVAALPNRTLYR